MKTRIKDKRILKQESLVKRQNQKQFPQTRMVRWRNQRKRREMSRMTLDKQPPVKERKWFLL